ELAFLIEQNFVAIGMVGINMIEPDAPELGYWLGVEHWGQGFGTEAARAAIDYYFEEFHAEQLFAGARVTNPASRNILEKCG
ncbi:GNAT family N-acetyltransferase, partial [Acinetobacter baumannii]